MLPEADLKEFVAKAVTVIHEIFFEEKTTLKTAERRAFIDIFYQLLTLKVLEDASADSFSFTCKDGVDGASASSALFYGLMRALASDKALKKDEKEQFLWMLYAPALTIRERAILKGPFQRTTNALEVIFAASKKDHKGLVKQINSLYKTLKFPVEVNII